MNGVLIIIFTLTYFFIILEEKVKVSKSASALTGGLLMWLIIFLDKGQGTSEEGIYRSLEEIASLLFFLMGAMATVEVIDIYGGFEYITYRLSRLRPSFLFFWISLLSFVLSSFLDNLTTTVVMASILGKTMQNDEFRKYTLACVVSAANAGGVFSPIGDVTSTMLWISGRLSATNMLMTLLIPAIVCFTVPYIYTFYIAKKNRWWKEKKVSDNKIPPDGSSLMILFLGMLLLLSSPILNTSVGMPPFAGMLLGLGILWGVSEMVEKRRPMLRNSVASALSRIDLPGILFFFGILMGVSALGFTGILQELSDNLHRIFPDYRMLHFNTGLISSVLDNVPLVAGMIEMFPTEIYSVDHPFWNLLCYSSGTGGSLLIMGSAAGVVAMNSENISFLWYLKKITFPVFLGYISGYLTLILIL